LIFQYNQLLFHPHQSKFLRKKSEDNALGFDIFSGNFEIGAASQEMDGSDPFPLVRLDAGATWLLTEIAPELDRKR
jgi:hypothetical protein